MARRDVLLALNIIPGKIYMAKRAGYMWEPVMIETTDEPGYLRGHVLIENFGRSGMGYVATARVRAMESGDCFAVGVRRRDKDDPWELADSNIFPTVIELPSEWIDGEIAKVKHAIAVHDNRLKILNVIKSRIK